ncbi:hypothetical protein X474_04210 [Dethiosulfatarculus sandiegensis]|uniref:Uncharacterized protein n=1 Tax=Dethiosulfatarculus sandiegensis TaxID=1429043 RepID=A0A0D2JIG0_9BACT|nr:hypothetical protein X474_04210 [Dethiosulfatarculus sandiegensis]
MAVCQIPFAEGKPTSKAGLSIPDKIPHWEPAFFIPLSKGEATLPYQNRTWVKAAPVITGESP